MSTKPAGRVEWRNGRVSRKLNRPEGKIQNVGEKKEEEGEEEKDKKKEVFVRAKQ